MIEMDALFRVERGYYNSFQIQCIDEATRNPINLTGYDLFATFRERGATPLLLTLSDPNVASSNRTTGLIEIIINENNSQLLPSRDQTYCGSHCDSIRTCIMQIHGTTGGKTYLLATIAIDNISSTKSGETAWL
jgi:hypothetical protein